MKEHRVVIVGAGPGGIFAALKLASLGVEDILILEKGPDLENRICRDHSRRSGCRNCPVCFLLSGWGGAGAFSDGKLTLSPRVGGFLGDFISGPDIERLIGEVDRTFLRFGAPRKRYEPRPGDIEAIRARTADSGLTFVPSAVRHMGTDGSRKVLRRMREFLGKKTEIRFGERASCVLREKGKAAGVITEGRTTHRARFVILAPGRSGVGWLSRESARLGLASVNNPVDIGVRVETPAEVLDPLTGPFYEAKLLFVSPLFGDQVRTFCMCPRGEVVMETMDGIHTVNGQSWSRSHTPNSNFALLVRTSFTEPFDDPITYGRHVAGLANLLSGGVLVQRLGDLDAGKRSTVRRMAGNPLRPSLPSAAPGDLAFALPYRHLADIRAMIKAMEVVAPGLNDPSTLLYGVEAKFYSIRLGVSPEMETDMENLFAVGDGAGVSRSLVQAACSGMMAASAIASRLHG